MSFPLRVPLEVFEKILSFAFTPLASPSSSSSSSSATPITSEDLISPPLGTSHLLLVSKGTRQLALPFYYSIVSIAKGADYSTFLDPKKGLLVGENNEERAFFVKELWINVAVEAQLPLDYDIIGEALQEHKSPKRAIVELEQVVLPDLDILHLFLCGSHPGTSHLESLAIQRASYGDYGKLVNLWGETTFHYAADKFWESDAFYSCPPSNVGNRRVRQILGREDPGALHSDGAT